MPRVRRKPQGFGQNQRVRQKYAPQPDRSFPNYERPGNRMDPMAKRRVQQGGASSQRFAPNFPRPRGPAPPRTDPARQNAWMQQRPDLPQTPGSYWTGGGWKEDPRLAALGIVSADTSWDDMVSGQWGSQPGTDTYQTQMGQRGQFRDALQQQGLLDNFQRYRRQQGLRGAGNFDDALMGFAGQRADRGRAAPGAYVAGWGVEGTGGPGQQGFARNAINLGGQQAPAQPFQPGAPAQPFQGQPAPAVPYQPNQPLPPGQQAPGTYTPGTPAVPQPPGNPPPAVPSYPGTFAPGSPPVAAPPGTPPPEVSAYPGTYAPGTPPQPASPPVAPPPQAPAVPFQPGTPAVPSAGPQAPAQPFSGNAPSVASTAPQSPQMASNIHSGARAPAAPFQGAGTAPPEQMQTNTLPPWVTPPPIPGAPQPGTPSVNDQNPGADANSLLLNPQYEAGVRALDDELSATLAQIGVSRQEAQGINQLIKERLGLEQRDDMSATDEAMNSRGLFDSGIRTTNRNKVERGYRQQGEDIDIDFARTLRDLASGESGARSGHSKGLAELLMGVANSMAEKNNSPIGMPTGGRTTRKPVKKAPPKKKPPKKRVRRRRKRR